MKKKLLALFLCLSISSSSIFGCRPEIDATDLMADIRPTHHPKSSTIFQNDNVAATDFSVRLFQKIAGSKENALISPLSILPSLAMTANGARGETKKQMEDAFGMPTDLLNEYLSAYTESLPKDKNCKFHLANSIWLREDKNLSVRPDFLQMNADWYHADIYQSAFDEETLRDINTWVAQNTDGTIPKILNTIQETDSMYLINALSFDAKWSAPYRKTDVEEDIFTKENGTIENVELMYSTEYEYLEDEYATGFFKPYSGYGYAFVALLPKEGIPLHEYIATLSGERFHHLMSTAEERPVLTAIPKFKTEFSIDLVEPLKALGISTAFHDVLADFSGIGTLDHSAHQLCITQISHKSVLSLGEQGTKAGAVTTVTEGKSASRSTSDVKEVILNRPFLYMIIDYENHVPIFIGTADDIQNES